MESTPIQTKQPMLTWMLGPAESRGRAAILGGSAVALTLAGSFFKFLNYNQYPIATVEVALVFAGILAMSIAVGVCCSVLGVIARLLLPMFLANLAIDLHSDGQLLPALGVLATIIFNRFSRQAIILLFAVVIISETWTATTGWRSTAVDAPMREPSVPTVKADFAIVHLILDEHIGLEGIPDSVPGGTEVREELQEFYLSHGFRVFGGAYSESLRTVHAVPRALSLRAPSAWKERGKNGATLEQNPYFDNLQSMGFQIDVIQSGWVDFCQHTAVKKCKTRNAGDLIDVGDKLPTTDKATILIYRFATLSSLGRITFLLYDSVAMRVRLSGINIPPVQLLRINTSSLNAMASVDEVIESSRSLTPGVAMFAHILLPHFPYVHDRTCGLKRVSDWLGRMSAVPWETRYAAYLDQVTCTTRKVEAVLDAVASSPAAGKTVFIIHGDHGSRIMRIQVTVENDGRFSDRDLVDGYAAFFAVAAPGLEPGYDSGRYPLRFLLDALVRSQFRTLKPSLPAGFVHTIAIEDWRRNPVTERSVVDADWWDIPSGMPGEN